MKTQFKMPSRLLISSGMKQRYCEVLNSGYLAEVLMSNSVLVVAEVREGALKKISLEMIGEGKRIADELGGAVEAVVLGHEIGDKVGPLAHHGAEKVYVADDPALANYTSEGYTNVLAGLIKETEPFLVLIGATTQGKDLAPKLAARLSVGLASDCTGFEVRDGDLLITRPIYAGKAIATVLEETTPRMATVRPNILAITEPDTSRTPQVEQISADAGDIRAKVIDMIKEAGERIELTEADIVVSGGRGLKGPENFGLVEGLASVLGAAVGASRAAVDAGWKDHSYQVGQTGKVVTPTLYIACGISGAIQHLAGMKTSKYIVAINKDPDAPIFKVADYGIVADLFKAVPVLTEEFKKMKAEG
jgi:electron transfer flavoprotein alpha subunit